MWRRPARKAVRLALAQPRLRAVVEAELRRGARARARAQEPPELPTVFVDRFGVAHPLDPALRDRLKPAWRTMLDPVAVAQPPSDEVLRDRLLRAERVVAEATALIAASAGVRIGGRILEVGCYDGAVAFQLARLAGTQVVASDLARYYVVQRPGDVAESAIVAQQGVLADIRERARLIAGLQPGAVTFVEDDITASALEAGTLDAIISFEVLEHVRDPLAAFAAMHRLLRPGGVGYHDYNPFFSINGGHSLCTLDFPWGHARLTADDFVRYLEELRPDDVAQTERFYRENLNRMTLADLRVAVGDAGLELVALVPWADRTLAPQVSAEVVHEVRRSYPTAGPDDLLATFVSVVVRRPA